MILTALNDYYQRLAQDGTSGISPPGYSQEKISFEILLDSEGRVIDVNDLRSNAGKTRVPKNICVPQPEKRAAGIAPNFLWDKTSYVLGVSAVSKRAGREHHAFKEMHTEVLADQEDTGLLAFQAFLDGWLPDCFAKSAFFHDEMMDANVVFRLDGEKCYLHDRPAAQAVRARLIDRGQNDRLSLCLVSGDNQPVAQLHPAIKGVAGGQSSGTSIVSFNLESFES